MKIGTTTMLLCAVAAGGLVVAAHAASAHGTMGGDRRIERMADRLDLDGTQLESVRAIVDAHRAEQRALRDQLREGRAQIRALSTEGDETGELEALAEAQGDRMAELIVLKARMRSEIAAVLTDEQREAFAEMGERGRHGRGHRR